MSAENPHEIIIIKRSHDDDEEGHHGGAWKIAFADFMTAMMALFLVLWLMSANEKTKESIAHYFNPIKLAEMTKTRQGLHDVNEATMPSTDPEKNHAPPPKDKQAPGAATIAVVNHGEPKAQYSETELFQDPFAVLSKIAARAPAPPSPPATSATEPSKDEAAFSDPFAPSSVGAVGKAVKLPPPVAEPQKSANTLPPVLTNPEPVSSGSVEPKLLQAIQQLATSSGANIQLTVTVEGTLISITDAAEFPMFASASAEPQPKLVQFMAKIGGIIKKANSPIVIRGFTDGRLFQSDHYDNWRLSADRANMARLMLVRGGVDEKLFDRIEGHADKQLKNAAHPEAAENRRIEILLRNQKP